MNKIKTLKKVLIVAEGMDEAWQKLRQDTWDYTNALGPLIGEVVKEEDVLRGLEFDGTIAHHAGVTLKSKTAIESFYSLFDHEGTRYTRGVIKTIIRKDYDGNDLILPIRVYFAEWYTEIDMPWNITEEEIGELLDEYGITLGSFSNKLDYDKEYHDMDDLMEMAKEYEEDLKPFKKYLKDSE
jgi:hypothetical protein